MGLGEGGASSHVGVEGGTFCNVLARAPHLHTVFYGTVSPLLLSHLLMSWCEPLSMEDNSGGNGL